MLELSLVHFGFSPLKGTRHSAQSLARLDAGGIAYNRRWGIVNTETGRVLRTVAHPELVRVGTRLEEGDGGQVYLTLVVPGQGSFRVEPPSVENARTFDFWGRPKRLALYEHPVNQALSAFVGLPVALAYAFDPLIYGEPLTLVGTATLEELARRLGASGETVTYRDRLRSNLVVETGTPFIEDTWCGRELTLRAGSGLPAGLEGLRVLAGQPVGRCAVIDANPATGVRDIRLLKSLATYRPRNERGEPLAGIYASYRAGRA